MFVQVPREECDIVEESRQDLKCDLVKGTVSQILYCCYNFLLGILVVMPMTLGNKNFVVYLLYNGLLMLSEI
jgi:hypothetical protein